MANGRTLVRPEWTTTPSGDVSATDWAHAKSDLAFAYSEAQLVKTRTFDSRAYASIQDAIDTAYANGGGTVFAGDAIPPGQDIVLKDGLYLTGRGVGATSISVNTITGTGSITALPSLATTVAENAREVSFTAAHNLQPGDVFIIYNTVDSSFNAARSYYRGGEFCRVRSVKSSTIVTLTHPTYSGYGLGVERELYKLNPIRTGVSNMSIECTAGQTGIKVSYGSDLEFNNLRMSGSNISHLTLNRCYSVTVKDFAAFDAGVLAGTNYGITISNSQRIRITDAELETHRHGLVTGGDNATCSVPNRDIIVSDSYINGLADTTQAGVTGCNLHGNSEFVRYENCTMPSGVTAAGDHVKYNNCTIGTAAWGGAVVVSETIGVSLSFQNCKFRFTDNSLSSRPPIYLYFDAETVRATGTLIFENNEVDMGAAISDGASHVAVYLQMASSSGSSVTRSAYVRNNIIEAASMTSRIGVRIATTGTDLWSRIDYDGNGGRLGEIFNFTTAGTLVRFNGTGPTVPSFAAWPGSVYRRPANPGTAAGKLYINENGDTTWTVK